MGALFHGLILHYANGVKEKNDEQPGAGSPENGSLATLATRILEWYEVWREYVSVGGKMKKWAVLACLGL